MSPDRHHIERPPRPGQEESEAPKGRRFNPLLIFGIAMFAVAAFYVLLIVITIADDIFLPGNEIKIGISLPGVDSGENPEAARRALNRLVDQRKIRPCLVGGKRRYSRRELDRFIDEETERYAAP